MLCLSPLTMRHVASLACGRFCCLGTQPASIIPLNAFDIPIDAIESSALSVAVSARSAFFTKLFEMRFARGLIIPTSVHEISQPKGLVSVQSHSIRNSWRGMTHFSSATSRWRISSNPCWHSIQAVARLRESTFFTHIRKLPLTGR